MGYITGDLHFQESHPLFRSESFIGKVFRFWGKKTYVKNLDRLKKEGCKITFTSNKTSGKTKIEEKEQLTLTSGLRFESQGELMLTRNEENSSDIEFRHLFKVTRDGILVGSADLVCENVFMEEKDSVETKINLALKDLGFSGSLRIIEEKPVTIEKNKPASENPTSKAKN